MGKSVVWAIRVEISEPDQWRAGDVAIPQNQKARTARHIGSLVFDCPLRQEYDEGVEVRSLLPNERLEERDGYTVVTDISPDGVRYVKFWADAAPDSHHEEADAQQMFEGQPGDPPGAAAQSSQVTKKAPD